MEPIVLHFEVDGDDFAAAGSASAEVKRVLKSLGIPNDLVRRVSICMYEGEINMVIHAHGGSADIAITDKRIDIRLSDTGPGIADVELAMKEGYSTAPQNVRDLGFGAGMGLSNMKKHSDEMKIDSTVGVGTTVTMSVML